MSIDTGITIYKHQLYNSEYCEYKCYIIIKILQDIHVVCNWWFINCLKYKINYIRIEWNIEIFVSKRGN